MQSRRRVDPSATKFTGANQVRGVELLVVISSSAIKAAVSEPRYSIPDLKAERSRQEMPSFRAD